MNKGLILVFLCLIGMILGMKQLRSLNNEKVALQIEYLGTCKDFTNKDLASVRISRHTSGNCLPLVSGGAVAPFKGSFIDPDLFYQDVNNLQSDYFCTDLEGPKALIHFVEIYDISRTLVTDYILSFVPSSPFRARTNDTVYTRRPSCETDRMLCTPFTETVTNCTPNVIQFGAILEKGKNFMENAYVITRDRIYLSSSTNAPALCDDGVTCCSYIASKEFGGMCPYQTGDFVLPFLEDYELHSTLNKEEHKDLLKQNPYVKQVFKHKKVSHKAENKPLKVQHVEQDDSESDYVLNNSVSVNVHTPHHGKKTGNAPSKNANQVYHHSPQN